MAEAASPTGGAASSITGRRRSAKIAARIELSRTVDRAPAWGEFVHDTPVMLAQPHSLRFRGARWGFRNHCTNRLTGTTWIELYGGRRGHQTIRAFPVEAVLLIRRPAPRRRSAHVVS